MCTKNTKKMELLKKKTVGDLQFMTKAKEI